MDYDFIEKNIADIENRINDAAAKSGRSREDILLLAVTKTVEIPLIQKALSLGLKDFGENKVQELLTKCNILAANWHLIGHLQTNKVKNVINTTVLIHSVESLKLADEISKRAQATGVVQDILVEVNIAGEASKFGIPPEAVKKFIKVLWEKKGINVKGLMTVAPYVDEGEKNRDLFKKMRHLFLDINHDRVHNEPMTLLSMGMTGDFQEAILEGSNIIRIGTGIFGHRNYL